MYPLKGGDNRFYKQLYKANGEQGYGFVWNVLNSCLFYCSTPSVPLLMIRAHTSCLTIFADMRTLLSAMPHRFCFRNGLRKVNRYYSKRRIFCSGSWVSPSLFANTPWYNHDVDWVRGVLHRIRTGRLWALRKHAENSKWLLWVPWIYCSALFTRIKGPTRILYWWFTLYELFDFVRKYVCRLEIGYNESDESKFYVRWK